MTAVFRRTDDGNWALSGELTLRTIPALLDELPGFEAGDSPVRLSLAGIERVDSASVAVLFMLLRRARRANVALSLTELPEDLLSISRLCGVDALLSGGVPQQGTDQ